MAAYRWEVPPLVMLIIPADAGRPRMTRCRCLYLFRGIWPRKIAFGWENLDVTLKTFLSVPSLFFMEKEDVYPAPFLIPSSQGIYVSWNHHFDGCLKTFITKLKALTCVAREHRSRCTQWGALCTHVSHPPHDGRALRKSIRIFSHEIFKLSCYKL